MSVAEHDAPTQPSAATDVAPEERASASPSAPSVVVRERLLVGAPAGHFMAWVLLALSNAAFIALTLPRPPGGIGIRVRHHLFDAGHLFALGLLVSGAAEAWSRWGPRRSIWGYAAAAAASILTGALVLRDDLDNAAARLPGPTAPWLAVFIVAVALVVPASAIAGRVASRSRALLAAAVAISLAGAISNQFFLRNDYPGVHLFWAWGSATLLGVSLGYLPMPARLRRVGPRTSRAMLIARVVAAIGGATSVILWPGGAVIIELFKLPGSVAAPFLVSLRSFDEGEAHILAGAQAWFTDRSRASEVSASSPRLLPKDGIVIVVIVDCMRADLLADEKHAASLPNLVALRGESLHFGRARSAAPATTQSLATLFSGRHYSQLYWKLLPVSTESRLYPHEDTSPRFPEALSAAGISTAVVANIPGAESRYGLLRGFTEQKITRTNAPVGPELTTWTIERLRKATGPLFLYLHYIEAHAPYDRAGRQGTQFERYLRELGLVDTELGRLDAALTELGLRDRTVLVVTADHGEAFGEHGDTNHGHTLYDELLRVPLLVRGPGVAPRSIDAPVSLIDLAPTVLDLFGQPTPGAFMGQSLVPFMRGENPVLERPIAAESTRWMRAMVSPDGFKVITDRRRGTVEVFDLSKDPAEKENLLGGGEPGGEPHVAMLRAFFQAHALKRPGYVVPYQN